ncbi:hypothetical protein V493_03375 [Pseudogymnoascus sp. VKM F-4281 (FW-2241)]|nr:hypothetical protein V493_03375 [Pseudogymnoascus sp. VKM F-4281 (FW-2241)]
MADSESAPKFAPFIGMAGIAFAMIFGTIGAAYGTAKSGIGISGVGTFRPDLIMKSLIPVVMSGIIAVYSLVIAVLIAGDMAPPPGQHYALFTGFLHLAAGLSVGLTGLAAGYAIGIVGDMGPEQIQHQAALLAQRRVGRERVLLKARPILVLLATHTVCHLGTKLHQGRKGLRVAPEDVPKVGVEEVARGREKEVVEMSVADAEEVGDYAVAGAGFDVRVHGFFADAEGRAAVGVVGAEVGEDGGAAAAVFG